MFKYKATGGIAFIYFSTSEAKVKALSVHLHFMCLRKLFCIVNEVASLDLCRAHDNKIAHQQHLCLEIRSKVEMTDVKRYINQIKTMT